MGGGTYKFNHVIKYFCRYLELSSKSIFDINLRKLPSQYGEVSVMGAANYLICICMNINENLENKGKIVKQTP